MTRLPRSHNSKRNEMNKNWYKNFRQPVKTKIIGMGMYVQIWINKKLKYFLSRGYEHV